MKRARLFLAVLLMLAAATGGASAQSRRTVRHATDAAFLLPAAAGVTAAFVQRDYPGAAQFGLTLGTALSANYLLEACVRKDRPDGTGRHAFPSTHTAVAFAGATFIGRRYGWRWSIPAYAVAGGVAWGRIYAKKHDIWDVLAGAAIGAGSALAFTHPWKRSVSLTAAPFATPYGTGVSLCGTF